jgi:hypothetical protein
MNGEIIPVVAEIWRWEEGKCKEEAPPDLPWGRNWEMQLLYLFGLNVKINLFPIL